MTYVELKESLKKTGGLIYQYTVEKYFGDSNALMDVHIDPTSVYSAIVKLESDELIDRILTGELLWDNSNIDVELYLNTKFGKHNKVQHTICKGWALTEEDAKAIVEQIKSDLKTKQLEYLKKQFTQDGVTKEDLLNLIEEMK